MARNIFSRQVYQLTDEWKDYSNLFSEKRAVIRRNNAIANRRAKRNSVLVWITQP